MHYGIDLAWGYRARTGVAEVDARGHLMRTASLRTDDEIAMFCAEGLVPGSVVAFDAPLIVRNTEGQRPCERSLARAFGAFGASAHPTNLSRPTIGPEPRAHVLTRRLDLAIDIGRSGQPARAAAIEVYPHPAMVSWFTLNRVIPYKAKAGRSRTDRAAAFRGLITLIEGHLGRALALADSDAWQDLIGRTHRAGRQVDLDRVEDEIDAVCCAHLAWLWAHELGELEIHGDEQTGFIVTPPPPRPAGA